jgi:hypothetical protein
LPHALALVRQFVRQSKHKGRLHHEDGPFSLAVRAIGAISGRCRRRALRCRSDPASAAATTTAAWADPQRSAQAAKFIRVSAHLRNLFIHQRIRIGHVLLEPRLLIGELLLQSIDPLLPLLKTQVDDLTNLFAQLALQTIDCRLVSTIETLLLQ